MNFILKWISDQTQQLKSKLIPQPFDDLEFEFGVNAVLFNGNIQNPFDANFSSEDEAYGQGKRYLIEHYETTRAVLLFRLILKDGHIISDEPTGLIAADEVQSEIADWEAKILRQTITNQGCTERTRKFRI